MLVVLLLVPSLFCLVLAEFRFLSLLVVFLFEVLLAVQLTLNHFSLHDRFLKLAVELDKIFLGLLLLFNHLDFKLAKLLFFLTQERVQVGDCGFPLLSGSKFRVIWMFKVKEGGVVRRHYGICSHS